MLSNSNSLRKILEQEIKKKYQDTVVIGGLDRYLSNLFKTSELITTDLHFLTRIKKFWPPVPAYSEMNVQQRKKWIDSVLATLDSIESNQTVVGNSPSKEINNKSSTIIKKTVIPDKSTSGSVTISHNSQVLDDTITKVKGISSELSRKFEKMGVNTIRDLLYFFPHRHLDYSQRSFINKLVVGSENTIIANIWESREVQLGTRRSAEATVGDETGNVRVVWFNQPYMARTLKAGQRVVISGKVTVFAGMPVFESPEWEPFDEKDLVHTGRWIPVYPLTQGLGQRQVRRIIKPAVDQWSLYLEEFLPADLRTRLRLLELPEAIRQAHYPRDEEFKNASRRRLAFDELFLLQLGVLQKKREWQENQPGMPIQVNHEELNTFIKSLPFSLTQGQNQALRDILDDMKKNRAMSRLLQGEVGSGKTVVATAALLLAVADGYQTAMMAPTEILAQQHFATLRKLFSQVGREDGEDNIFIYSGFLPRPVSIVMLIGDLAQSKKQKTKKLIESGEIDIVIGTHTLIQKNVSFKNLGLIVVDEQHRFGVEQRFALRNKGKNPHMLVMTATPIPRTLALTLYGDLDLSVINEVPPGRKEIKTRWLKPEQRTAAYNFIRKEVKNGRQAFIICPFVEESEAVQAKAAVQEFEQLSNEVFPDLHLGLLHGRMSSSDKEAVMNQFSCGNLDILVSTPVVEVGIDVPNATVMLIESADRFGLSQLHQFRGRIGRGQEQSYCMLLAENPSDIGKERLDLIEKVHNGFILAEEDLKLRGPGEFFGTRQSGLPDLKMARLSDTALLELARNEAEKLFNTDPELEKSEHSLLVKALFKVWKDDSILPG